MNGTEDLVTVNFLPTALALLGLVIIGVAVARRLGGPSRPAPPPPDSPENPKDLTQDEEITDLDRFEGPNDSGSQL